MIRRPLLLGLSILVIAVGDLEAQFKPVKGVTGEVRGIVKSVDGSKNTVTVTVNGALFVKEQTLLIASDARFQPCLGSAKTAADLKMGTFVVLFTSERDGKLMVIDLAEDKPEKAKAAKEKTK
jgi:hypothetical protein